jgi:hypothetical protein
MIYLLLNLLTWFMLNNVFRNNLFNLCEYYVIGLALVGIDLLAFIIILDNFCLFSINGFIFLCYDHLGHSLFDNLLTGYFLNW